MDKKLLYWAVALSCALLLMPAQMRAQAGLQTDTDGSVTGTAGTEYLWVNAANFPDDEFRAYMLTIAKTTGGQSYVVPADVTHLDMSAPCCENGYSVGEILSSKWDFCHYSWEGGKTNNYEPVPSPCIEQINAFFQDPQNVEEVQNHFYGEYDKINYVIRKHQQTVLSTVEVSNGMHRFLKKDIVFYSAEMNIAAADAYDLYDSEPVLYREFTFSESETLHFEHNYYQPSGDIADLTGIEHFANLRCLNCSSQKLRGELDLTALTKLDSLDCSNNRLTDLKVNLIAHPWYKGLNLGLAHQRVFLNCSNNYLTNLDYVSVSPSVEGQLVNFEGSYANNRILALSQGKHFYYDFGQGFFARGQRNDYSTNNPGYYTTADPYGYWMYGHFIPVSQNGTHLGKTTAAQEDLFARLGVSIQSTPFDYFNIQNQEKADGYTFAFEPYIYRIDWEDVGGQTVTIERYLTDAEYYFSKTELNQDIRYRKLNRFLESEQNIGVNLSVIDKSRNRVGVAVPDNISDDESAFEDVVLLDNVYPEKIKQDAITYYAYNENNSATGDLDYCHAASPVGYNLFNGYSVHMSVFEGDHTTLSGRFNMLDLSNLQINKIGDLFDPNIMPYNNLPNDPFYSLLPNDPSYHLPYNFDEIYETKSDFRITTGDWNYYKPLNRSAFYPLTASLRHNVNLNADHYVMYVNPISEDTEGLCNGTVVLDYDAIIPERMEAFIVTSYTAGGEDDRFKTGRLNLVKVGDGDCADGYKRVIPANNPVCLRTKQTVGEGQAADKMSTTGLYPFHRNNDRTLYPCPDPNDAQYEPLELIPSALFDGNKLRGVLDLAGQNYTAGDVLTLGRYKDNNEHKIGFWTYNGAKLNMHRVYVLKSELNIPSAAKGCTLDFGYDSTPTGIGSVGSESRVIDNGWYTLQGVRLSGKPAQSGIYIHNGKKVVVDSGNVTESGSNATAQEEVYTDNF